MAAEADIKTNPIPAPPRSEAEVFEKRWFCAAMFADGSIFTKDADSPVPFMEVLERASVVWIDYRTKDPDQETLSAASQLGFSQQLIASLTGESRLLYEDFDIELGFKMPSIQIRMKIEPDVRPYKTLFLIRKNFILTIHDIDVDRRFSRLRRYSATVLKRIPLDVATEDRVTQLLARIIDMNNDRNFEHLRQIEELGDTLNQSLMDPKTPREFLGPKIYSMKHALIVYLDALWETLDVLHDLRYGDAELITNDPHILERVGVLAEDVKQQIGLAEHLSEVLASGLEVLQSIYNNQLQMLNNRLALVMTYLTVLGTAVLVPNTLATMFGSPFGLTTKDIGWYIGMIIGSTILATALSLWWVKRSKWFPKQMD
jgi:magnesium transporter